MRRLTTLETFAIDARQPDLHNRMLLHVQIVQQGLWDQSKRGYVETGGSLKPYPISPWGLSVTDREYGNVVVFPNAAGTLYWTGDVPSEIAQEINKGAYQSPVGNGLLQSYDDFLAALKKGFADAAGSLKWLTLALVTIVVLFLMIEIKKALN